MPEPLRELRRGDDARENWKEINKQGAWLRIHERRLASLDDAVANLRNKRKFLEGGGGGKLQRFSLTSFANDYLVCVMLDTAGVAIAGSTTNVAKPPALWVSKFAGLTLSDWTYPTVSATTNSRRAVYAGTPIAGGLQVGDYQDELLAPVYAVGDEIFGMEADGATGVVVSGTQLTWLDNNVSARHWRAVRTALNVCRLENGVQTQRRMVVDGGPVY